MKNTKDKKIKEFYILRDVKKEDKSSMEKHKKKDLTQFIFKEEPLCLKIKGNVCHIFGWIGINNSEPIILPNESKIHSEVSRIICTIPCKDNMKGVLVLINNYLQIYVIERSKTNTYDIVNRKFSDIMNKLFTISTYKTISENSNNSENILNNHFIHIDATFLRNI